MLKVSHTTLIVLSGLVWLVIGCTLLSVGLNFIVESILRDNLLTLQRPILDRLAPYAGGLDSAVLAWMTFCLLIGYMKGRYVFAKSVQRSVDRILTLPNPVSLSQIYTRKYYMLLGAMVFLGVLFRLTPLDIRGGVDMTIGAALMTGAILYFRNAFICSRSLFKQVE